MSVVDYQISLHIINSYFITDSYSYQKLKRLQWTGTDSHTRKQNWNILADTAVFLNEKRANVCEHTTKMASLYICRVLTYIRSLLIEKDGSVRQNISILFSCVCSCACPLWSLEYSVRVLTFLSLILCYSYFGTFLSTWSDSYS